MLGLVYTRDDEGNTSSTWTQSLPEPDYKNKYYTGKAVVSHVYSLKGSTVTGNDSTGATSLYP